MCYKNPWFSFSPPSEQHIGPGEMTLILKKTGLLLKAKIQGWECGGGGGGGCIGQGQGQLPGKGKQPIYVAVSVRNAVSYDPR